MEISLIGSDGRMIYARDFIKRNSEGIGYERILLLPVPSSRDKETVTGTELSLDMLIETAHAGDLFVCYGLPEWCAAALGERGASVLDIGEDEEYLLEGAYLTALGTVGHILSRGTGAICDMKIGIIGYGRIGRALAAQLLSLGGKISVYSGGERAAVELKFRAASVYGYEALAGLSRGGLDLLINTAPEMKLRPWQSEALSDTAVIELASGNNIPEEIACERLMALPAVAFPKSAGYAVGRAVLRAEK